MRALARRPDDRFSSAEELRTALLGIRFEGWSDHTVVTGTEALVAAGAANAMAHGLAQGPGSPGDTPAGGTPAVTAPMPSARRVGPGVVVSLIVVLVLVLVALLVATTDVGRELFSPDDTPSSGDAVTAARLVPVTGAHSFDPQGDDAGENDQLASAAIDGRPDTGWRTVTYQTRTFGNLKSGVGLVIELPSTTAIDKVAITSPTVGWAMSVYAADGDPHQLLGWGSPVASVSDVRGTTTLDLGGARGTSILLWITDLGDGPQNRVEITDVLVSS
jgi:hypothetical protein